MEGAVVDGLFASQSAREGIGMGGMVCSVPSPRVGTLVRHAVPGKFHVHCLLSHITQVRMPFGLLCRLGLRQ